MKYKKENYPPAWDIITQLNIANELAEANRLKRLEMMIAIEDASIIDQDSLEDQAV